MNRREKSISDLRNKITLIGRTSHCGKSTLAESLFLELNVDFISKDNLAKHPGRLWKEISKMIPVHVIDHYLNLSDEELIITFLVIIKTSDQQFAAKSN